MRNLLAGAWLLIGIGLLVVAGTGWFQSHRFKVLAIRLPGRVVGSAGPTSSARETNVPVVRFTAPTGEVREHAYAAPLAGDTFEIGDEVSILFEPHTGDTRMDDWSELYLWPTLLGFVAVIVLSPFIAVGALRLLALWPRRSP